jgi:hypothetical protein
MDSPEVKKAFEAQRKNSVFTSVSNSSKNQPSLKQRIEMRLQ